MGNKRIFSIVVALVLVFVILGAGFVLQPTRNSQDTVLPPRISINEGADIDAAADISTDIDTTEGERAASEPQIEAEESAAPQGDDAPFTTTDPINDVDSADDAEPEMESDSSGEAASADVDDPPSLFNPQTDPLAVPPAQPDLPAPQEVVPNTVVITFAPNATAQERAAYIDSLNGTVTQELDALNAVVIDVPQTVTQAMLPSAPEVIVAEPDYYATALADPPGDPLFLEQWALELRWASRRHGKRCPLTRQC